MKNRFFSVAAVVLVFLSVVGCNKSKSVKTLDYYYPLSSIKDYVVYAYSVHPQDADTGSFSYVKIGHLSPMKYFINTMDEGLNLIDSTVIRVSKKAIEMEHMYIPVDGKMVANEDTIQVIYPLYLEFGKRNRTITTHTLEGNPYLDQTIYANEASLMREDSASISIRLMSQFVGVKKDGTKDSYTMMDEIINKKGVGTVYMSNRSQFGIEITELLKVYSVEDWQPFRDKIKVATKRKEIAG